MRTYKRRWITTRAEYEWRDGKYVKVLDDGYWYTGPVALATTPPTIQVTNWGFYQDDGTDETDSTIIGSVNTNPSQGSIAYDTNFQVRFDIEETSGNESKNTTAQLQYNHNGAGWTDVTGSSNVVRASASTKITDGGDTAAARLGGSYTYDTTNEGQDDVNGNAGGNTADISSTGFEVVFCVQLRSADVGSNDTVSLRIVVSPTDDTTPPTWPDITAPVKTLTATVAASTGAATSASVATVTPGTNESTVAATTGASTASATATVQRDVSVSATTGAATAAGVCGVENWSTIQTNWNTETRDWDLLPPKSITGNCQAGAATAAAVAEVTHVIPASVAATAGAATASAATTLIRPCNVSAGLGTRTQGNTDPRCSDDTGWLHASASTIVEKGSCRFLGLGTTEMAAYPGSGAIVAGATYRWTVHVKNHVSGSLGLTIGNTFNFVPFGDGVHTGISVAGQNGTQVNSFLISSLVTDVMDVETLIVERWDGGVTAAVAAGVQRAVSVDANVGAAVSAVAAVLEHQASVSADTGASTASATAIRNTTHTATVAATAGATTASANATIVGQTTADVAATTGAATASVSASIVTLTATVAATAGAATAAAVAGVQQAITADVDATAGATTASVAAGVERSATVSAQVGAATAASTAIRQRNITCSVNAQMGAATAASVARTIKHYDVTVGATAGAVTAGSVGFNLSWTDVPDGSGTWIDAEDSGGIWTDVPDGSGTWIDAEDSGGIWTDATENTTNWS